MRRSVTYLKSVTLATALLAVPLSVALADRQPTPEERARIENVLRQEGFVRWEKIEFDDGRHWEIDDAVMADGRKFDLKLNEQLSVIAREQERR